jgi:hypothetical protein
MARIEKKFEIREKTLRRLLQGKGKFYEKMILVNEEKCREMTIRKYKELHGNSGSGFSSGKDFTSVSPLVKIQHFLLFESNHTARGCISVVFDCLGHAAFYAFLARFVQTSAVAFSSSINTNLFYVVVMGAGVVLMRANGYIWSHVDRKSYDLVKFEMHNRAKLGYLDARVLAYLKDTALGSFFNLLSFYLIYIGVSYFYHHLAGMYEIYLEAWWVRVEADAAVFLSEGEVVTCATIQKHLTPRVLSYVCLDSEEWSFADCLFHGFFCLLSALVMHMVGTSFLGALDN